MKEIGRIIEIEDNFVFVELRRHCFCSKCWRCTEEREDDDEGESRQVLALARDGHDLELYDRVEIEVSDNIFYVNLLIEYLMPIGDFFIGYLLVLYVSVYYNSPAPELNGFWVGIIFFSISFWLAQSFSNEILITWNQYPRITRIIKNSFAENKVADSQI